MRTITVTGTGQASTPPDKIIVTMTIVVQAAEYEKTMETAGERLDALRVALSGCGFASDDIRTVSFNVNTEYQHEHTPDGKLQRHFVGYICTHQLKLEFDLDLDRLASIIAAISGCKCAPEFSVQFGVKDEESVKAEILRSAVANAAAKAEILASASGVSLGEIVTIDYSMDGMTLRSQTHFAVPMLGRGVAKASMDFVPENIAATENVTIVWEIE